MYRKKSPQELPTVNQKLLHTINGPISTLRPDDLGARAANFHVCCSVMNILIDSHFLNRDAQNPINRSAAFAFAEGSSYPCLLAIDSSICSYLSLHPSHTVSQPDTDRLIESKRSTLSGTCSSIAPPPPTRSILVVHFSKRLPRLSKIRQDGFFFN